MENLPTLKVLDLSRTNIQSLPPSICTLSSLTVLILQECSMLMELPPEIGKLKNLVTFDLEGTEILYLPKEMGKLENLQCLRVSFCPYADEYKDSKGIENIIPREMMSKFSKLEELSIFVNPDAKWWEVEFIEAIAKNLHFLPRLQTLKLYLPTAKAMQFFQGRDFYSTLRDFRLKIGHSEQLTTCLNTRLVESFEKLEKCLKYENGEGSTDGIKELVRNAKSLFVCRHWTIEKLSIFDISSLKYCLLAECNEMQTIVDAYEFYGDEMITNEMPTIVDADEFYGDEMITNDRDGKEPFESLQYLAVHSMKNLQSLWKGPIDGKSFSCLLVLALHTCPDLTTIFTVGMLNNLNKLTVLIVEDCPKVTSLVSPQSTHRAFGSFLRNLRKLLLLDLPELVCLSNGVSIAPQLDTLLVFNCLKLDHLSQYELSSDVKEIKGETEWWDALKNRDLAYSRAFVPLKRDGYLMNQLAQDTNSLTEFYKLWGRGKRLFSPLLFGEEASEMSGSTQLNPYEPKKQLDDLLRYLKFGTSPLPLAVPLGEASAMSGSTQFRSHETEKNLVWVMFVQYLKYRKPPVPLVKCNSGHVIEFLKYQNKFGGVRVHIRGCLLYGNHNPTPDCFCPFREAWGTLDAIATRLNDAYEKFTGSSIDGENIRSYLNEVRKSQENALGIPSNMQDFPALTVEEKSDFGRSLAHANSSLKKEDSGSGTRNDEKQGFRLQGAVTESSKLIEALQESITGGCSSNSPSSYYSEDLGWVRSAIQLAMSQLLDEFRAILQVNKIKSRETSTRGSSSLHVVQDDDYVKIYTISPELISQLRIIAMWASSNGCTQPFVDIYIHERKTIMQSRFLPFNFTIWSTYEIKRFEWGVLESLIEAWIMSVKTSFDHLFASEKQLCEKIFQSHGTDIEDNICFEVIIQDYQIQAFNIIYTLSFSSPPPDKIFMILDLYETLDHFLNKISFFAKQRSEPFHSTVRSQLLKVLSDKITSSLSLFETALLYYESSVIFVGPVDPLPRYVMSYVYQLCDHKHAMRKMSLPELPSIDDDDHPSLFSDDLKGQSELSRHVIWIIMMMVSNLEAKAKLCEDGSAGQFFAMKNIHYIAHKIERHKALMEVVGDDYFGKLIQKFDQAKVKYVILSLRSEGNEIMELAEW